jgi:hypothetical protein
MNNSNNDLAISSKDEAIGELALLVTKGIASITAGMLTLCLENFISRTDTESALKKELQRQELRTCIKSGVKLTLKEMGEIIQLRDNLTLQKIADVTNLSIDVVKKAIKPWWVLF